MILGLSTTKIIAIAIVAMLGGSYVIAAHNTANDKWTVETPPQTSTDDSGATDGGTSDSGTNDTNTTTTTTAVVLTTRYMLRLTQIAEPNNNSSTTNPDDTELEEPTDGQIIGAYDNTTDSNPETNPAPPSNDNQPLPIDDPAGIIEDGTTDIPPNSSSTTSEDTAPVTETPPTVVQPPDYQYSDPPVSSNPNEPQPIDNFGATILSDGSEVVASAAYINTVGQIQTTMNTSLADHWRALWHFGTLSSTTYTITAQWDVRDTDTNAEYTYSTDGSGTITLPSSSNPTVLRSISLDTAPLPVVDGHHYIATITATITISLEGQDEVITMPATLISFDATGAIA